jgi:ketosteroid isomerase-like protein
MTISTFDYKTAAATFYRDLDADDPEVFQRWLAPAAVFAFNDVAPVMGRDQIASFIGAWKSNFASLTHVIDNVTVDAAKQAAGIEVRVSYNFLDGRVVVLKGCSFLDFDAERITGYRVYIDTSSLS